MNSIINQYKKIIIYGAQKFAVATSIYMQLKYSEKEIYAAVTTKVRNPEEIAGIKVHEIEELSCIKSEALVIISVRKYATDIERVLQEKGFYNYIEMDYSVLQDLSLDYGRFIGEKVGQIVKELISANQIKGEEIAAYIGRFHRKLTIDIQIVGHCNLNCQSCNVFSPLVNQEFMELNEFTKDLFRLKQLVPEGELQRLTLIGGEPLLHPCLRDFILESRNFFPDTELCIFTNGIKLLDFEDEFFELLHTQNVNLIYTEYPIDVNYKEIETRLIEHKIKYYVFNGQTEIKKLHKLIHNLEGEYDANLNFIRCPRAGAETCIKNHKVFACSIAPSFSRLNRFFHTDIALGENDGADLSVIESYQELLENISRPMEACRFCGACNVVEELEWKTSERKISEWV